MWRPRNILANSLSLRGLMGTLRRMARAVLVSDAAGVAATVPSPLVVPSWEEPGREERGDGVCWSGLITDVSS
jgi:hypothetical protein